MVSTLCSLSKWIEKLLDLWNEINFDITVRLIVGPFHLELLIYSGYFESIVSLINWLHFTLYYDLLYPLYTLSDPFCHFELVKCFELNNNKF